MGNKKRPLDSVAESEDEQQPVADEATQQQESSISKSMKPMERLKKRRALAKDRRRKEFEIEEMPKPKGTVEVPSVVPAVSGAHALRMDLFSELASVEASVREAAAEGMAVDLGIVQKAFEKEGKKGVEEGVAPMEAKKDEGFENCAPSLIYAIRRLVRGVSSSRECARQGFALGLTMVVGTITSIRVDSVMKLIEEELRVSGKIDRQDARECLLGRLFAYGSLARSGRISAEWMSNNSTPVVKDFISSVVSLAMKKRYLHEPAVSVILEAVEKLPVKAISDQVLKSPGLLEWFEKATAAGDPDALLLALKLQERVLLDNNTAGKLLPCPFSSDSFFSRNHLLNLASCFKESSFCLPRVHSLWPLVINYLVPDTASQHEDKSTRSTSSSKYKRNRKGACSEEVTKNIRNFCEVVIEESLLLSSHDRKHLAFDILLLLLPRLPVSSIQAVISAKLVLCLMDVLSTKGTLLYDAAQHFVRELIHWTEDDDDRRVGIIISLQKHSSGRFDSITRTQTVKELVSRFNTGPGCFLFVHNLISLFVDGGAVADEPSDQSQTTDENSEGTLEDDSLGASENADYLKKWIIDTMPRVLKNLKLDSSVKSLLDSEFVEEKFRVQTAIMKFLAVQGLFSASLGTEVTSFELEEKFKWPKAATSSALCKMCIEQLTHLLEDAQKGQATHVLSNGPELYDLGFCFIRFLDTLRDIPSVSFCRTLGSEDEKAFKKLKEMESRLSQEARNIGPGTDANKLHSMCYLLIQLLLQVLLHPGEFFEAALELVICCKKAFPAAAPVDSSSEEEDEANDGGAPELLDVLVDTFLSLLPQTSSPMFYAIEQVFRLFCDDITNTGLRQMLRVVKKDLKPAHHQALTTSDDEDEEEDCLAIEDPEEIDGAEAIDAGNSDRADDEEVESEGMSGEGEEEPDEKVTKHNKVESEEIIGADHAVNRICRDVKDHSNSDDSDGMDDDDDEMFRKDSYLMRIFRARELAANDSIQSQLMPFKLRVLSLLEIYLHKNPGKSQVLTVYSFLAQAFVNYQSVEGSEQLVQRIGGILQKKIFKAKDYPKGDDIQLSTLEALLEKSLKSASRSRYKTVSSLAQTSAFWLIKIIQARNFPKSELERMFEIGRLILLDYFTNKKSRLKAGFAKEIIRRHPCVGLQLFGFILENCRSAKSEFRRVDSLDLVDCIIKSSISSNKAGEDKDASSKSEFFKKHMSPLCELIHELLSNLPEKQSRRAEVRRLCSRILQSISVLQLNKSFLKALKPEAYSNCESQLGHVFLLFKKLNV